MPLTDLLLLRSAIQPSLGNSDVHKLYGPDDADIDADTVRDLITEGQFSELDFVQYCEQFGISAYRDDGQFNHIASQGFLNIQMGQFVMSLSLFYDDEAPEIYSELVRFAKRHELRLWCPMPGVQGDIDLESPGYLPPRWEEFANN